MQKRLSLGDHPYASKFACEFFGTGMLVLIIQVASAKAVDGFPPIAIGFVLMNMIYSLGHISGAHFNPAVTLGILVRNIPQFPRHDLFNIFGYLASQFIGGTVGGYMAWSVGGSSAVYQWPHVQKNASGTWNSGKLLHVFMAEFIFTFFLVTVVLNVATDQRVAKNQFYGACIGTTVMLSAFTIGAVSGCCLNPAVWVGTVLSAIADSNKNEPFYIGHFYLFWLGELGGGILAGLVYNTFIKNGEADGQPIGSESDIHQDSEHNPYFILEEGE